MDIREAVWLAILAAAVVYGSWYLLGRMKREKKGEK